jgi:hypothetical protein
MHHVLYVIFFLYPLQLKKEMREGGTFDGWLEGPIDFPPTYKYEVDSNCYAGENAKPGDKRRSPAWYDRDLFLCHVCVIISVFQLL